MEVFDRASIRFPKPHAGADTRQQLPAAAPAELGAGVWTGTCWLVVFFGGSFFLVVFLSVFPFVFFFLFREGTCWLVVFFFGSLCSRCFSLFSICLLFFCFEKVPVGLPLLSFLVEGAPLGSV